MKTGRVVLSGAIVAALLVAFFVVPLPVSRVRQTALVQLQEQAERPVLLRESGQLDVLNVRDGQRVSEGDILAVFINRDLDRKHREFETQYNIYRTECDYLEHQLAGAGRDSDRRGRMEVGLALSEAAKKRDAALDEKKRTQGQLDALVIRAPRAGWVINPPHIDEVGKYFDSSQPVPFCTIGDPKSLRVLVPVRPSEYRLLKQEHEELTKQHKDLAVTIRVQGRGDHTWEGEWQPMPESEAKSIPLPLSNKAGGPIAVKPSNDPNQLVPQNQQYMLSFAVKDPDRAICPGSLAQVKISCRWQSAAWWVWHTVNDTFDLGLM